MSIPIPLGKLELSPMNVRQTDDGSGTADLEASILAHGMLSPLIVHTILTSKGKATGRYGVLAGGRRLRALQALRDRGDIPKDHPVDCVVRDEDVGRSTEISVIENTARVALPPIEEFRAFAKLAEDPAMDTAAIAHRFGVTELHVKQRMRLGQVHPEILDAYGAGKISSLDAVKAYTATADQALQLKAFQKLGTYAQAFHIRSELQRAGSAYDLDKMLQFVGVDAYVGAGGAVEEDLFVSGQSRIVHPGTLADLYFAKLETEKARILETVPACVSEIETVRPSWNRSIVHAEPVLTDAQRARRAEIDARCEAITGRLEQISDYAADGETLVADEPANQEEVDRLAKEAAALEQESEAIVDGADQQLPPGPIVAVALEGSNGLQFAGYCRPEGWRDDADGGAGAVVEQHRSIEAAAKADYGLTSAAIDAMRSTRRMILQAAILDGTAAASKPRTFEIANRFLVFVTLRNLLTHVTAAELGAHVLPQMAHDPSPVRDELTEQTCMRSVAACVLSAKDAAWITEPDLQAAFAMFDEAPKHTQGFAAALATSLILSRTLATPGFSNVLHDQLGFMLALDDGEIRSLWSPDRIFFDRMSKKWRIAAVAQVNPLIAKTIDKLPTGKISAACERFFRADDDARREFGMMPGTVAHAQRWLPRYLQFIDTPPGPRLWETTADEDASRPAVAA